MKTESIEVVVSLPRHECLSCPTLRRSLAGVSLALAAVTVALCAPAR
jgi:hypothetical protein